MTKASNYYFPVQNTPCLTMKSGGGDVGLAIQNRMSACDLLTLQIGTHTLLTAPPTAYPLIKAAEAALKKVRQNDAGASQTDL